jgi:intracellular sulfur oxidation DsrE/DsrF family protein
MHARVGIPIGNIQVAEVVHGTAVKETADELSSSAGIVAALTAQGVRIIVCGQSAANRGVATDDLLPGVEMALSAMTAHAVLQQQGYTLNPF